MPLNHYDTLGVQPGATAAELRRAYLHLARRHHPDFHLGDDQTTRDTERRRMQAVNEAWRVLGDSARRREYDRQLAAERFHATAPPDPVDDGDEPWDTAFLDEDDAFRATTTRRRPWLTMVPVLLVATAVALFCVGVMLNAVALMSLSFLCLVLAAGMFVLAPFVAMTDARRQERR
jgi:hypothetical protein